MLHELLNFFISLDAEQLRYPGFVKTNRQHIEDGYYKVKNGKGWQSKIKYCPLCNCKDGEIILTRFDLNYIKCLECGGAYIEKFPVDTSDIYNDEDYARLAKEAYLDNSDYRKQRFGIERIELIKKYCNDSPSSLNLLDIGCGTGWFLEVAIENGFKVSGLELGKKLAELTAERLKINIFTDPLNKIDKNVKFDVITMFDVIEHVVNPVEVIESIHDHLNPGGIGLLYTPNLESLAIHYLKEYSGSVIPVHHMFIFSKNSLERIFRKAGFELVYFATKGSDVIDMYSHHSQLDKNKELSKFLLNNADLIQAIVDKADCGNHMRFVVKKLD